MPTTAGAANPNQPRNRRDNHRGSHKYNHSLPRQSRLQRKSAVRHSQHLSAAKTPPQGSNRHNPSQDLKSPARSNYHNLYSSPSRCNHNRWRNYNSRRKNDNRSDNSSNKHVNNNVSSVMSAHRSRYTSRYHKHKRSPALSQHPNRSPKYNIRGPHRSKIRKTNPSMKKMKVGVTSLSICPQDHRKQKAPRNRRFFTYRTYY
jgi:hypothetical protein